MRSLVLALAVCSLNLPHLVGADKAIPREGNSPDTTIVIEARFVSMRPEIGRIFKRIDPNLGVFVPPTVNAEVNFSPIDTKRSGSSDIQLISTATVVEEQRPVHILKLNTKQKSEILQIVERLFSNHVLAQAPKINVADNTIGQIADTSKSRKSVSVDFASENTIVDDYDEGTTLLARPHLNESGSIDLDLLMRVQHVQEVNLYDNHNGQAVIPKLAKAQVELTVNLKPGESVALWFCHKSTPEPAASTTLTKIPRKKNPEQEFQSQLILIVTPEIATKQVAASTSR